MLWRVLFITVCVFSVSACWSASFFPEKYDHEIKRAAKTWLPGDDWRLLKAQYYQESQLNPSAVSAVGAEGIAQFMPGTWLEVSRAMGKKNINPKMAKPAILAGAWYMARMKKTWIAPRPEADRYSLALASYNAGAGNLIKAQRKCGGKNGYAEIISCLPDVTGRYATETINYVKRIWRYWTIMLVTN